MKSWQDLKPLIDDREVRNELWRLIGLEETGEFREGLWRDSWLGRLRKVIKEDH